MSPYDISDYRVREKCDAELHEALECHADALPHRGKARTRPEPQQIFDIIRTISEEHEGKKDHRRQHSGQVAIHFYMIDKYYAPCSVPLDCLTSIVLSDLKQEVHHEGHRLIVKVVSKPVRMQSAILAAVEDESGDVDMLMLYSQPPGSEYDSPLRKGDVVALKHPYYQAITHRIFGLGLYHSSDMVVLEPNIIIVPEKLCEQWDRMDAEAWKTAGNMALKKKDFGTAIRNYSRGVLMTDPYHPVYADLQRNRALARMKNGEFEAAMKDCFRVLVKNREDVKALLRLVYCFYELGNYEMAQEKLKQISNCELDFNERQDYEKWTVKVERRLEESQGIYNFDSSNDKANDDHAPFTSDVHVRATASCGNGLFTARSICAGSLILCDKPLVTAPPDDSAKQLNVTLDLNRETWYGAAGAPLFARAVSAVAKNPSLAQRLLRLHAGDFKPVSSLEESIDGTPVLDTEHILQICRHNSGFPSAQDRTTQARTIADGTGSFTSCIWPVASFANHSCLPNAAISFVGNLFVMRAIRNIAKGEEITISYQAFSPDVHVRRQSLEKTWGFHCRCELCTMEALALASSDKQMVEERDYLVQSAEAEMASWDDHEALTPTEDTSRIRSRRDSILEEDFESDSDSTSNHDDDLKVDDRIMKLENMILVIASTYPSSVYRDEYPRPDVLPYAEHLMLLLFRIGRYALAHEAAMNYLRFAGWHISSGNSVADLKLNRSKTIFPLFPLFRSAVAQAFVIMAECEGRVGDEEAKEKFEGWARDVVGLVSVNVDGTLTELKESLGIAN